MKILFAAAILATPATAQSLQPPSSVATPVMPAPNPPNTATVINPNLTSSALPAPRAIAPNMRASSPAAKPVK